MSMPPIEDLIGEVMSAESALTRTMMHDGRGSKPYGDALKQFAVKWFVLQQSRNPDEFIPAPLPGAPGRKPSRWGQHRP